MVGAKVAVDSRGSLVGLLAGTSSDDRARQILRAGGELKMLRAAIVRAPSRSAVAWTIDSADRPCHICGVSFVSAMTDRDGGM